MKENPGTQPEGQSYTNYIERLKQVPPTLEELMARSSEVALAISGGVHIERKDVEHILAQLQVVVETRSDIDNERLSIVKTDIRILSNYLSSEETNN